MNKQHLPSISTLRFESLTLQHPGGGEAFSQVTLDIPAGQNYWVKASSGSGKSLLLRLLGGLEEPSSGAYLVNGIDVARQSFESFAPLQRRVGFSFEFGGLLSNKTIRQNLMLPFFYHHDLASSECDARVEEYLDYFDLGQVRDLRPASCSGGRRKAGCVARALITRPELLLLDHPTDGLNEKGKRTLLELLARHRRELGLKFLFIVSDDDRFMETLEHSTLNIADKSMSILKSSRESKEVAA